MAIKIDFQDGVKANPAEVNQNFIDILAMQVRNEIPGGTINGSNPNFTSAFLFKETTLCVYQAGIAASGMVRLERNVDYTETINGSGQGTGFQMTVPPSTNLIIDYQKENV